MDNDAEYSSSDGENSDTDYSSEFNRDPEFSDDSSEDDSLEYSDEEESDTEGNSTVDQSSQHPVWTSTGDLQKFSFVQDVQPSVQPSGVSPIDYFNFFFDKELLQMICDNTNAQAERMASSDNVTAGSRIRNWRVINVDELKTFLGLLLHMGTIRLIRIVDYWRQDFLYNIPIFSEKMGRNRFLLILRCLYFSSKMEDNDADEQVSSLIEYFNKKMDKCYYPGKELLVKETSSVLKHHFLFRPFVANRREQNKIKLYALTEPKLTKINLPLIVGYHIFVSNQDKKTSSKDHGKTVVLKLLENKLKRGHSVYIDNDLCSYDLAQSLIAEKTHCTGPLGRNSKGKPKEVIDKEQKKGENISRFREGVHVGKWKESSEDDVLYITTEYPDRMVARSNRHKLKPEAIMKYNEYMSAVDWDDTLLFSYPCERMRLRWPLKVAIHIFQTLFVNSYKMYNKLSRQPEMRLHDYRISVIRTLLHVDQRPVVLPQRMLEENPHGISSVTERTADGRKRRKQCRQCWKRKKRTDTTWCCTSCPGQPGLCVQCFDNYHLELLQTE